MVTITGGGPALTYEPHINYCNTPSLGPTDNFTYTLTPGGSSATVAVTRDLRQRRAGARRPAARSATARATAPSWIAPGSTPSTSTRRASRARRASSRANFDSAEDELGFTNQNGITRQLQRRHRRADPDRHVVGGELPGGAALGDLREQLGHALDLHAHGQLPGHRHSAAPSSNSRRADIAVSPTNDSAVVATTAGNTPTPRTPRAWWWTTALTVTDPDDTTSRARRCASRPGSTPATSSGSRTRTGSRAHTTRAPAC